jgi:Protein of unknown function (DUF3025)
MPKSGQPWVPDFLERSWLLAPFRELARPLLDAVDWPTLEDYTALAERERSARAPELPSVRFSPPKARRRRARPKSAIEPGDLYDGRVVLQGEVPCVSASYHDLCNVIVWAAFPRAKRALHARQFRALQGSLPPGASRLPNRRTREQDALTLFDEGGSVLLHTEHVEARPLLFGHGLMEHVAFHQATVRSAAFVLEAADPLSNGRELFDVVDRELSRRLIDSSGPRVLRFDRALSIEPPAIEPGRLGPGLAPDAADQTFTARVNK